MYPVTAVADCQPPCIVQWPSNAPNVLRLPLGDGNVEHGLTRLGVANRIVLPLKVIGSARITGVGHRVDVVRQWLRF